MIAVFYLNALCLGLMIGSLLSPAQLWTINSAGVSTGLGTLFMVVFALTSIGCSFYICLKESL